MVEVFVFDWWCLIALFRLENRSNQLTEFLLFPPRADVTGNAGLKNPAAAELPARLIRSDSC